MLRHAFYWRTPVGEREPPLTRYVNGWGRPGDRSLIAIEDFVPVGAAWYRLFTQDDAGFGFVDEETPELAIAVVPSRRGRGFGRELLAELLERARGDGFQAISLSVARDNPAVALYESYGFERLREDENAVVMRAAL
jgi:ribosomal protein S18 acetylase RimI-like enzyme